jgi:hypothetical protein
MKIQFLQKILDNLADINLVHYTFFNKKNSHTISFSRSVLEKYINKGIFSFQTHRRAFAETVKVDILIEYKSSETETISFNDISSLV